MYYLLPDYYDDFTCTADKCQDNCCIGWDIAIDDYTWDRYQKIPGAFGDRLRASIDESSGERCFIMQPDGRCPFLNKCNKCDIIINLGEPAISDICDEHPRFTNAFAGWSETGLGLCCEEAARLILSEKEPAAFVFDEEEDTDVNGNKIPPAPLEPEVRAALERRWQLFMLLQKREYPLLVRFKALLEAEQAGNLPNAQELYQVTHYLQNQEFMTPEWPRILDHALRYLTTPLNEQALYETSFNKELGESRTEYEQLAFYFLFRYYMDSVHDGAPAEKVRLAVGATLFIRLLALADYQSTHEFPNFARRLRLAQLFSKEVEYNEDAIDGITEILSYNL